MKLSKRIMALIIASILSIGLVGCSKNKENEISDALPQEGPVEEVIDGEEYTDDSERALAEYEGNMNPIEDESAEDVVINNGLKELSREEVVESFRSNTVKIVLEGKVEDYRNFEPTIRKEAEYFIKNIQDLKMSIQMKVVGIHIE